MIGPLIGFGLAAIAIVVTADGLIAGRQHRRPETGTALIAGTLGIVYFIAMIWAAGGLR